MRKLIILSLLLLLMHACKKQHADYQFRILIKNGTDSLMTVKLYPKSQYMHFEKYLYSEKYVKYKDTTFVPENRLGSELFVTDKIGWEPHLLATEVFDSINVSLSSGKILRFSPGGAINYPSNLFTEKEAWIYERNRFEYIRMWRDNYLESDDYIFVIEGTN
jgi:hypothetical protein